MAEYKLDSEFDQKRFKKRLEQLYKKGARVELKEIRNRRSTNQNSMVHSMLAFFADELRELTGDTSWTLEEAKILVKRHCGIKYEKGGQWFLKSTAEYDTKEFTEFVERFIHWAIDEHGIVMPTREEWEAGQNPNKY